MSLLRLAGLSAHHGHLRALTDVGLELDEGDSLAVIGANGAGKSTLLRTVAGLMRASTGTVEFDGVDITRASVQERVRLGVALVPEGRRLFATLTVRENLLVGTASGRTGPWDLAAVGRLFPLVQGRLAQRADTLSGGQQQAVAIGRALMANPRLLLLDEVSLGLAPVVVHQLYAALPEIVAGGTTVLLVEQDLSQALRSAQRLVCLLEGRVVLEGAVGDVSRDEVTAAYFGQRPRAGSPS